MIVRELVTKLRLDATQAMARARDFDSRIGGIATMARRATIAVASTSTAIVSLVKSTGKTQSALGALSSIGVKDLKVLEDAATDFTNKWAGYSKSEFLEAAWNMRSAIDTLSDEAVANFTSVAALTAKASKGTIAEMTSAVTKGYGIFKPLYKDMTDQEWLEMYIGGLTKAVGIFDASGDTMAAAIKNIGAVAATARRPLEEQLAVLGIMQRTMSGEEAGVLYKNFILKASAAGKKLGLEFADAEGHLKSITEIISLIKEKYPDLASVEAREAIQEAFGTDRAVRFVMQMSQEVEHMDGYISQIKKSMDQGLKTTYEMAQAVNEGPNEEFAILRQRLHNLAEELGKALTPSVIAVSKAIGKLTLGLQYMTREAPKTTKILFALLGAFLSMLVVGGIINLLTSMSTGLGVFTPLAKAAAGALGKLALMSWASLGVLGLVAGAIALLTWDVSRWVRGQNSAIGKVLGPWDTFKSKVVSFEKRFVEASAAVRASIYKRISPAIHAIGILSKGAFNASREAVFRIASVFGWLASNIGLRFIRVIGFVLKMGTQVSWTFARTVGKVISAFDYLLAKFKKGMDSWAKDTGKSVLNLLNPWTQLENKIKRIIRLFTWAREKIQGIEEKVFGEKKPREHPSNAFVPGTGTDNVQTPSGKKGAPLKSTTPQMQPGKPPLGSSPSSPSKEQSPPLSQSWGWLRKGDEFIEKLSKGKGLSVFQMSSSMNSALQGTPRVGVARSNNVQVHVRENVTVNVPEGTPVAQARSIDRQVRDKVREQIVKQIHFALNDIPAY